MATRKTKPQEAPKDWTPAQFVNYDLSKENKAEIKAWQPTFDDLDNCFVKLTEASIRVTFKYDDYNHCESCFLTPIDPKSPNTGLILGGRGSTPLRAFKQVWYIHSVLFDGNWAEHFAAPGTLELDD